MVSGRPLLSAARLQAATDGSSRVSIWRYKSLAAALRITGVVCMEFGGEPLPAHDLGFVNVMVTLCTVR